MKRILLGRLLAISIAGLLAGCGADNHHATSPSTPPGPSIVPGVNAAPTVTLASQGSPSCNPAGTAGRGCTVALKALASDPDGDPLTYSWSGTTAFSPTTGFCFSSPVPSDTATCLIYSPEQVVVGSVVVRDDHGNTATASLQVFGEGVNHAPQIVLSPPMPLGGSTLEMFGRIEDPDEGALCQPAYVVSGSASGDCKSSVAFWSSCLEGGPTVDIYRTAPTGTCQVTLKVRDSANLVGTTVTTIRY